MNVQDAKELNITEGEVRSIHDSDGKLLWGRVEYDTKYEGDIFQQTYTGKNLFDNSTLYHGYYAPADVTNLTANESYRTVIIDNLPAGTYTFSTDLANCALLRWWGDGTNNTLNLVADQYTFTTTATGKFAMCIRNTSTSTITQDVKCQVESGEQATSFEPYVGGIPAPNPSYPQPINVVTGTQTVTLTGGTVSEDYTLSLGSIELCKIDSYADYIYKSQDGNWYLHKETNKVVLDGREPTWNKVVISGATRYFTIDELDALIITDTGVVSPIISNTFTSRTPSNIYTGSVPYGISLNPSTAKFRIRNKDFSETADFANWLSTHNTTVYYALATPTDTQIEDSTLISQLEAIDEFMQRYGYTATISGNIAISIKQEAIE